MITVPRLCLVVFGLLLQAGEAELFGRRRQTGSRRRTGARPDTNVKYGISDIVFYVIIGVGSLFVICLIASIVYYFCVRRKRDQEAKEKAKYRPVGRGYDGRTKEERDRELEEYLSKVKIESHLPNYDDFEEHLFSQGWVPATSF
eukprot:sb/3473945/